MTADNSIMKLDFQANPVQRGFIQSRARADLFASRRGEGKSTALAWACLNHTRQNPNARWCFIRDTFENLQKTTQQAFFQWFPPGHAGTYHVTKKEWTWAEQLGSGSVLWMGMDDPSDASRLLSLELAGFAMDEPAPAATSGGIQEMVFDLAMTCLRQPGINWYGVKLAENNPDESHWTYRHFVGERQEGFELWQPSVPENIKNLPADYYENMRKSLAHRPDLIRRFVDGEFGFQSEGRAVTPQWSDKMHLALGLTPIPRLPLYLLWDWGHNPTCLFSQIAPNGQWLFLDALVGDGIGVEELLENEVLPLFSSRYAKGMHELVHIYDPAGGQREQTSIARSPIAAVKGRMRGSFRPGPVKWEQRSEPAQAILSRATGGQGLVRVDRHRAAALWHALRGGWHYPVGRSGLIGSIPRKNIHSHPGDAFSYGAAILYPLGKQGKGKTFSFSPSAQYTPSFGAGAGAGKGAKDTLLGGQVEHALALEKAASQSHIIH